MFPTVHQHWGMMDVALWENTINAMLQIGGKPCAVSELSLTWNFFRSMEACDRFGGPNGTCAGVDRSRHDGALRLRQFDERF